jgi:hypothetical protein
MSIPVISEGDHKKPQGSSCFACPLVWVAENTAQVGTNLLKIWPYTNKYSQSYIILHLQIAMQEVDTAGGSLALYSTRLFIHNVR